MTPNAAARSAQGPRLTMDWSMEYTIFVRTVRIDPERFEIVGLSIPLRGDESRPEVLLRRATNPQEADDLRVRLVQDLTEKVVAGGGRVLDVQVE